MDAEDKNELATNICRQLLVIFDLAKNGRAEVLTSFADGTLEPKAIWAEISWAHLYEASMELSGAEFLDAVGTTEKIKHALSTGELVGALGDIEKEIALAGAAQSDLEEEKGAIGSTMLAFLSTTESLGAFGSTMDELIVRARKGDDLALFQAIYIDRSVITGPTAAQRIQHAELSKDEEFFDKLSRTLKRSYPPRPEPENDRIRFALEIFRRFLPRLEMTKAKLDSIIVDELKVYGDGQEDSLESAATFRKRFFRKRVKDTK